MTKIETVFSLFILIGKRKRISSFDIYRKEEKKNGGEFFFPIIYPTVKNFFIHRKNSFLIAYILKYRGNLRYNNIGDIR
jgi:hypothetical protein